MRLVGGAESGVGGAARNGGHRGRGRGGAEAVTWWAVPDLARYQALPGFYTRVSPEMDRGWQTGQVLD